MKRNIIHLLILFLAVLLFSACERTVKVGFLMDESVTGRWAKDKELFTKYIQEQGAELVCMAAEMDMEKQYQLAQEMLDMDIDVLVLVPTDMNEAAKIVLLAHKKGIRVISYDRLTKNCGLDYYISFDHVNVGEIQAEYLTAACPKGKYALLGGAINDNNSMLLRIGQLNVLQPLIDKGDIQITYDNYANSWTIEEGYRMMKECLKESPDVTAVIAANDRLATGANLALAELRKEKTVCLAGMDADLEACQRIIAGTQNMTVYKPIEAIALKAAEVAIQIATEDNAPKMNLSVNNGFKQVPAILLPAMVVSLETIELTVVADGYLQQNNLWKK